MLLINTNIKESPGKGIGLFAEQFIPKDTKIWEFTIGAERTCAEADVADPKRIGRPLYKEFIMKYGYLEFGQWVVCLDNARFMNHSEAPNTYDDKRDTFAKQDIQIGEEITCNYFEICDWVKKNGLGF